VKLPISWLREFVDVPDDALAVSTRLAGCGFAAESVDGDVIDFEVTANRPDCLSVLGLAREAATAFSLPLRAPSPAGDAGLNTPSSGPTVPVVIDTPACGRYAMVVADVRVAASPAWLADRLIAAGVRPINNIVDVTNYVMLELGQPMHAFDYAKLTGPEIHVRAARAGEQLTTLDGETRKLAAGMPVIADRDRAVALAGVMGGRATEVSNATTRIAIESAWFDPKAVRLMARKVGLNTEASARFERGADIDNPVRAIARALALIGSIDAGRAAGPVVDVYPAPVHAPVIDLRREYLNRLLGLRDAHAIPAADVVRVLTSLGFGVESAGADWRVTVPAFRVDVTREADLVEEVGRHWGFDRIPATFPALRTAPPIRSFGVTEDHRLARLMSGAGLQEAATFTFIEHAMAAPFVADASRLVTIANPLSEKFVVLRPSLIPGLLDALVYNRHRQQEDVRLFESGAVFSAECERRAIGWVLSGSRTDHWSERREGVDFFDAKGIAELVGRAMGRAIDVQPGDDLTFCAPGRRARLVSGGTACGWIGQVAPTVVAARGLKASDAVYAGEIDLREIEKSRKDWRGTTTPPRHPAVVRDLSFVVNQATAAADILRAIQRVPRTQTSPAVTVRIFDHYEGKGIPDHHVSLSFRLMLQAEDRTLTDTEVQDAVDAIVRAITAGFGATLR
jgi:phenylalanyl-tRNA synthetase beta chain